MSRTAKITSKGQITIPRDIRRILGVRAGDRLLFEESESGFQIRPARQESPFAPASYSLLLVPFDRDGREKIGPHQVLRCMIPVFQKSNGNSG